VNLHHFRVPAINVYHIKNQTPKVNLLLQPPNQNTPRHHTTKFHLKPPTHNHKHLPIKTPHDFTTKYHLPHSITQSKSQTQKFLENHFFSIWLTLRLIPKTLIPAIKSWFSHYMTP